ncbi:unnamed protein product [Sordaria macrospora k-hell]|uniref:WGS project CABT00000000 data, contig 2.71 n=2 Tax=Sordaria macrospora TaxID=5147 RepID=F7WB83_SORMK|nr:uncharacterized protein SMAC_09090 [Sordaria macrospora k-hell]CCC05416.1 unnamed protein product [Sordaria macrospora k-hell]
MDSSNSYMLSPQATRSQTSSPVVGGMTEGKTQNGTSLWNASVRAQTGSDEFEHYAFHSTAGSSSAAPHTSGHGGLTQQSMSSQSSPRSWSSPDHHFRPVSASGSGSGSSSWGSYPAEQQSSYPGAVAGRQNTPQISSKTLSRENLFQSNNHHASTATSYPSTGSFYHQYPTHNSISSLSQEPSYPPSPCSSIPNNFKLDCDSDMFSTAPASEAGDDFLVSSQYPSCNLLGDSSMSGMSSGVSSPVSPLNALDSTPTTTLPGNSKAELPYAQLIYKAFMSTPNKAMTLQDIYQWFRENTEKGNSDTKGWQNSIRHNLSMNHAFTKRERKPEGSTTADEDNAASTDANNSDSKKTTEWYLEPWAIKGGVQSTTRYRKGNHASRRAAAASACNASRRHMKDGKYDLYSTGMSTRSSSSLANRNKISKSVGNRGTLRSNGTAPLQMHYYGHHMPQQHHYGVSMVTSAPEQHYNPYMSPVSARPTAVTHGLPDMMSATCTSALADYYESYTDPAILASSLEQQQQQQQQQQQAQAQREASEPMSIVGINEPITPEASFGSPPLTTSSSSASYYPSPEDHTMNFASAAAHHGHAGYHQPQVYQDDTSRYPHHHHNGWEHHAQSVAVPATGMMYGHYA